MTLLHTATRALTLLALGLPGAGLAIAPAPAGQLALAAPVAQLRAASQAPRLAALLLAGSGQPAGLLVLDGPGSDAGSTGGTGGTAGAPAATPRLPVPRGFLALGTADGAAPGLPAGGASALTASVAAAGGLALSPDGRRALVLLLPEPEKFNTATRHRLLALDLSEPDAPRELWRRELHARQVLLAPDASAWAVSAPASRDATPTSPATTTPQAKTTRTPDTWATTVTWLDAARPPVVLPDDSAAPVRLSAGGSFLAWEGRSNQLRVADLRAADVRAASLRQAGAGGTGTSTSTNVQEQSYSFYGRHHCTVALLDNGHVLVEDQRAPRLGVYAPGPGMPRLATLAHDSTHHCMAIAQDGLGNLLAAGAAGVLRQVNLAQPASPFFNGQWQLPPGLAPLAAAGTLLYAARGNTLHLFRLDQGNAVDVDWAALAQAHAAIMARHAQARRQGRKDADAAALAALEAAGAALAPDSPIQGLAPRRAAAILADFGRLLAPDTTRGALAEFALKRATVLDPGNATAALNLADLWLAQWPALADLHQRAQRGAQIGAAYGKYLQAGGKPLARFAGLLPPGAGVPQPPPSPPAPQSRQPEGDICDAIARHANTGQLARLVARQAVDVMLDGRRVDLVFTTEGTARVPAIHAFDAATDEALEGLDVPEPGGGELGGGDLLALATWQGQAHVLHYRDLRHPVATAPLAGGPGCRFAVRTTERIGPAARVPALCRRLMAEIAAQVAAEAADGAQAAIGAAGAAIAFHTPAPIAPDAVKARHGESTVAGVARVDFANDGRPATVALLDLSSGAGAGCELQFFDLLDTPGRRWISGPRQALLLKLQGADLAARYPLHCFNRPRLLRHGGATYFEDRPAAWPPQDEASQYHRVARVHGGAVRDVCDFRFDSTVSAVQ